MIASASKAQALEAIEAATAAFESWKRVADGGASRNTSSRPPSCCAAPFRLRRAAHVEVGKSWPEADGDTAEAIDFLEFYAREAVRYAEPHPIVPMEGERNEMVYIPLGVGAVIPPWNFAGAIMIGMTAASIVSGNTVAAQTVERLGRDRRVVRRSAARKSGVPAGVVNFVPGSGSEIGDSIVGHPKIRYISFTGSKEVGLHINELAAKTAPGQKWIKRVVAEMGGKDSIVVAADADVDAAVEGVAVSAFGFQGQKCSACSRAIVDEKIYDEFVDKLQKRVAKIKVGDPTDPTNYMGPVVNEAALKSISKYIETGKKEGRVLNGGNRVGDKGYFLEPTVIADVAPDATISQEEIFGPVLAVIKAKNFDDAMEIANNTEFGLTGSLYTTRREEDRARARRVLRRQPLLQPQEHRRVRRRASVRRLQHVGHRQQSRRPRLLAAVHAGKNDLAQSLRGSLMQNRSFAGAVRIAGACAALAFTLTACGHKAVTTQSSGATQSTNAGGAVIAPSNRSSTGNSTCRSARRPRTTAMRSR